MGSAQRENIVGELLVVGALALLCAIIQIVVGDFPLPLFRYPLSLILFVVGVAMIAILYTRFGKSRVVQSLLSRRATWFSLGLLVAVGLWLGLQREPASTAWPTVVALLFVLLHLALVTLRGWRNENGVRWRFLLNHLGLWLALAAGFWGAPDREELRSIVTRDVPTREVFDSEGRISRVEYELQLIDFEVEYYADGTPSSFVAQVLVDGQQVAMQVNHPYRRTWNETLYLAGYDTAPQGEQVQYCIVEIVRDGWRWLALTGIVMMLAGAVLLFFAGPRGNATMGIKGAPQASERAERREEVER